MNIPRTIEIHLPSIRDTSENINSQIVNLLGDMLHCPASDDKYELLKHNVSMLKDIAQNLRSQLITIQHDLQEWPTSAPAGVRRWVVVNGELQEVTLEQAAEAEGLTVPEYLAKEDRELRAAI